MTQDVISLLHPLRHPFDIRSPLDRASFWLFYLFYVIAGNLLALLGMTLMSRLQDVSPTAFSLVSALSVAGFAWFILAFQAAVVRRVRDAGFKARALVILWGLAIAYLGLPAVTFVPPILSLVLLGAALAVSLYLFVALTHRSAMPSAPAQEAP